MGQARNRKAEIEQLKNKPTFALKPISMGFFYQNDKPQGIGLTMSTNKGFPEEFLSNLYQILSDCVDAEIKEIEQGRITIAEVWEQLNELIPLLKGFEAQGVNNEESRQCQAVVMQDIWLLAALGEIKDDEFNGTAFGFEAA